MGQVNEAQSGQEKSQNSYPLEKELQEELLLKDNVKHTGHFSVSFIL